MAIGGRGRNTGDGDGSVITQLADLRTASRPGIADVDISCLADIHGFVDACNGNIQVDLIDNDRRAFDILIIEPLDSLIAAQKHRHGFLPTGVALRVQISTISKLCALYIGIAYADLRSFLCPCRNRTSIGKSAQCTVGRLGRKCRSRAEVLDEFEKLLPRQKLIWAERAVLIAVDNAVQMRLNDVLVRRIRKAAEGFV